MDLKSGEKISTLSINRPLSMPHSGFTAKELLQFATIKKNKEITSFVVPLSLKEKLVLRMYTLVDEMTNFEDVKIPLQTTSMPLKWALLLQFLRKEGITLDKNVPLFLAIPNDVPKRFSTKVHIEHITDISDGYVLEDGISGHGISENADTAASKAMGEFLERVFLIAYRRKNLMFSTTKSLKKKRRSFLDPASCQYFTNEQRTHFPQKCGDPQNKKYGWVKGVSLTDNKAVFLPAQLVYWNYARHYDGQEEPMLMEQNTSGQAGQFSLEKAILSGLRELIERDAFMIHWLKKIPPPRIDLDSINDEKIQKFINEFKRYNYQVELCDLTIDTKERVISAVIIDRSHLGPVMMVSASCHTHILVAIQSALEEGLACCYMQRAQLDSQKTIPEAYNAFYTEGINLKERILLLSNPKNFDLYAWFITGERYRLSSDVFDNTDISTTKALKNLIQMFKERKESVYYYEVKNKTLTRLHYHVVKVIVPGLVPIHLTETNAPLNHPRLNDKIPEELKQRAMLIGFNPTPHPFP